MSLNIHFPSLPAPITCFFCLYLSHPFLPPFRWSHLLVSNSWVRFKLVPEAMMTHRCVLALFVVVSAGIPADQLGKPHQWVPAEQCTFANPPVVPYFWDPACHNDLTSLGCWADGVHAACRFCGEAPYTGVHCPKETIVPKNDACRFDEAPATPFLCQFSVLFYKTFLVVYFGCWSPS